MRAIWTGTLSFGLVNIPVKLYPATEKKDIKFRLLHSDCHTPLKRPWYCPKCEAQISWGDTVRGYEFEKGNYIILEDEDFEKIPLKSTKSVDIIEFVKLEDIDPIYYDKSYYLGPTEAGVKAFELLRRVLLKKKKVGIAKVSIRNKESLVAIRAIEDGIVMSSLFYGDEIRDPLSIGIQKEVEISEKEVEMAELLIDALEGEFVIEKYEDKYREALLNIIRAKIEGREIEKPSIEIPETVDLMKALEESIRSVKES
ncbi:MAG: Ku protein [Candidatus Hydrothermarchaeota archaeon]